jgi:hypothetical protein
VVRFLPVKDQQKYAEKIEKRLATQS